MDGRLTILSHDPSLLYSSININGDIFPITNIVISGNVTKNVWTVEATILVKGLDIDLLAEIKSMKKRRVGNEKKII